MDNHVNEKIDEQSKIFENSKNEFPGGERKCEYKMNFSCSIINWFFTILIAGLPVFGDIALLYWIFSDLRGTYKRNFSIAVLLIKIIFYAIAFVVVYELYKFGVAQLDSLMDYVQNLK